MESKYKINVKMGAKFSTFDMATTATVSQLKEVIRKQLGVDHKEQILTFNRKYLMDDDARLDALGIKNMTADMSLPETQQRPFSFNSLNEKLMKKFSQTAPKWRIMTPGLNLEAKCKKSGCDAFGQMVWVQKGFGRFEIGRQIHKCICPICKEKTQKATNIGYYGTKIIIEGMREDGTELEIEEKIGKNELRTFQSKGGLTEWSFLTITATQL